MGSKPYKLIIAGIAGIVVIIGFIIFMANISSKPSAVKLPTEDAKIVNGKFIKGFFTYTNQSLRYKQIEAYTTPKGFRDTFPSGSDIPEEGTSKVSSTLKLLTAYENTVSPEEKRFLSEIATTTTFNGISSEARLIIKTTVVLVKGEGWKVDGVENVSEIGR